MANFRNGEIEITEPYYKTAFFDVSNRTLTAQFDGRGNVSRYAAVNKWDFIERYFTAFRLGGADVDFASPKTVSMAGRRQTTSFETPNGKITVKLFVDEAVNAVFCEIKAKPNAEREKLTAVINLELNYTAYLKELFRSRLSASTLMHVAGGMLKNAISGAKKVEKHGDCTVIRNRFIGDAYMDFALSYGDGLESGGLYYNQYRMETEGEGELTLRYVLSMGSRYDYTSADVVKLYDDFDSYAAQAERFIEEIPVPEHVKGNPFYTSYFKNLYTTSISMYKEADKFKGFIAGIVYQSPARTYYRDSYWTVLPVLRTRPDLVRAEILTLAKGIGKDGRCPSAVKSNFKNWWGDHYDSPSFFVIELFDYVRRTGDLSILEERWRGKTVLDAAEIVLLKLSEREDETGLLDKGGPYNRRDWCDNVFREGYVTYDECLYARAYEGLSYLYRQKDNQKSMEYYQKHLKIKDAINSILWDAEIGYYVNYKSKDFTERNLSIDTVVAVLFGVADEERARTLLQNMERMLESDKNHEQKAGDFGTLCAYPFYSDPAACVAKSTYPYYYHNGGDWPYLSAAYAYAKLMYGMDFEYPLTRWFTYNLEKENYTPVEFFSPFHPQGSLLQGWSSVGAFVLEYPEGKFFAY